MKMSGFILLAAMIGISILSTSCPGGTHVSVGVHVAGPYPPYVGPYPGPPVWIGRPYPGIW